MAKRRARGVRRMLAAAGAALAVPALVSANTTYYFVGTNGL